MSRPGSRCLSIFTHSLNANVLRAHSEGPLCSAELEERLGWAPESSLRASVRNLRDFGVLDRADSAQPLTRAAIQLTPAGEELLPVADALEAWLEGAPGGPVKLDQPAAQGIVRSLIAAWDSTMVRSLAERPRSLAELSQAIPELSYPALKRRLAKLRATRLVAQVREGGSSAHVASEWLRRAVAPLSAAGRWELRHDPASAPVSRVEVEAAFLLALPLLVLPGSASGACALGVLVPPHAEQKEPQVAGVAVEARDGEILACVPGPDQPGEDWTLGSVDAWFEALLDGGDGLRFRGSGPRLPKSIVAALRAAVFAPPAPAPQV